jgi:hypothetical protein
MALEVGILDWKSSTHGIADESSYTCITSKAMDRLIKIYPLKRIYICIVVYDK